VTTALYAGSFDPVHLGHVDIVEQAARCFERVVVGVMTNPSKRLGMFTPSDRLRLLRDATNHVANVVATSFDGLTVDLARTVGADVLVRAAHKEGRSEWQMAAINFEIAAIPTVLFPASLETVAVSSSIIRSLTLNGRLDAVRHLVPPRVGHALAEVASRLQTTSS
jgi:pantetheine-phosphate adenylyltransferase